MTNRYHVAAEDLANMVEIARVSSYAPDKLHWTELALYFRDDPARPWVPVVEGRTDALDMSNRFKAAAMGTIERAMSWFEGSELRDRLSQAVSDAIGTVSPHDYGRDRLWWHRHEAEECVGVSIGQRPGAGRMLVDPVRREGSRVDDIVRGLPKLRVVGITTDSLGDVLRWLYPNAASDAERTRHLERDFGMPARTTRRALAVESGEAQGEPGAWVNMFMVSMRFFDRELWMAGQATIASVES